MSRVLCHRHSPTSPRYESAVFLSTRQLANLLGVSLRKLERDRQDGTGMPFVKLGRRVLYRSADVELFLQSRRFISTAEARREREGR